MGPDLVIDSPSITPSEASPPFDTQSSPVLASQCDVPSSALFCLRSEAEAKLKESLGALRAQLTVRYDIERAAAVTPLQQQVAALQQRVQGLLQQPTPVRFAVSQHIPFPIASNTLCANNTGDRIVLHIALMTVLCYACMHDGIVNEWCVVTPGPPLHICG